MTETGRPIGLIRPIMRSTELPARAFHVECHRVEVNLSPVERLQYDSDGSMTPSHYEPNPFKCTQHLRESLKVHDEVNVLMRPGFFAKEPIYSPPSVQPRSGWDSPEGIKDAENVGSFHRLFVYQARLHFAWTVRPCRMPDRSDRANAIMPDRPGSPGTDDVDDHMHQTVDRPSPRWCTSISSGVPKHSHDDCANSESTLRAFG